MVTIEFNFNQSITNIQATLDEPIEEVINKYFQKSLQNPDTISFLLNGEIIEDQTGTVENYMSSMDKQNQKMRILVTSTATSTIIKNDKFDKSRSIICPECKEPCRISIEKYKVKLFECANGHEISNIKFTEFENTQKINESSIICGTCNFKNKGNCPKDEFYYCLTCQQNLCLLCKSNHDPKHNIILYDQKNYICQKHNEYLIKYCTNCKINFCFACEEEHKEHLSLLLGDLVPNMEIKQNILNEMKTCVDEMDKVVKEAIDKLTNFSKAINSFYEINKSIFDDYDLKRRNYYNLKNLDEISYGSKFLEYLKDINKSNNNINGKLYDIINLYNNLNNNDNINYNLPKILENFENIEVNKKKKELNKRNSVSYTDTNITNKINPITENNSMTLIYNISNYKNKIKLFDYNFVRNNKDKCYLMINNEKKELKEQIEIDSNLRNQKSLEIKLIETKIITAMNSIFSGCTALKSLPDISNWNMKNITNMSSMFNGCVLLKTLPDISNWNMENVTNISSMFSGCASLKSLPDISKWDLSTVTNMSSLFSGCTALRTLPDISKWNLENVTNISSLFKDCNALISLPDISKWNTKNITNISYLFHGCNSLKYLPEISKWDIKNISFMNYLFYGCRELVFIPDLSSWDIKNVVDLSYLFRGSNSLEYLPDISKWETKQVTDMSSMFSGCTSLKSLQIISKWELNKNLRTKKMFDGIDFKLIPKNFKKILY